MAVGTPGGWVRMRQDRCSYPAVIALTSAQRELRCASHLGMVRKSPNGLAGGWPMCMGPGQFRCPEVGDAGMSLIPSSAVGVPHPTGLNDSAIAVTDAWIRIPHRTTSNPVCSARPTSAFLWRRPVRRTPAQRGKHHWLGSRRTGRALRYRCTGFQAHRSSAV